MRAGRDLPTRLGFPPTPGQRSSCLTRSHRPGARPGCGRRGEPRVTRTAFPRQGSLGPQRPPGCVQQSLAPRREVRGAKDGPGKGRGPLQAQGGVRSPKPQASRWARERAWACGGWQGSVALRARGPLPAPPGPSACAARPSSGVWLPLVADVTTAHGFALQSSENPQFLRHPFRGVSALLMPCPRRAQPSDPRGAIEAEQVGQGFSPSLDLGALLL